MDAVGITNSKHQDSITTMASATKKIKINGALYRLNTGVQVWTRRGKAQLVARIPQSDGRVETQFFEMSADGVKMANNAVNLAASEIQTYGSAFGALSALERHAVEVYRAYVKECIGQGVGAMPLQDVLDIGLKKARELTSCVPTFGEVVPEYMEYLKKNASAKHCEIRGIMLRKICRTWGTKRLNLFTEEDVNAYLAGLQGRHGKEPSPWTRKSYYSIIRAFFLFAVKRRVITAEMNPMRNVETIDTSTDEEPAVLSAETLRALLLWTAQSERWRPLLPTTVLAALCGIRAAERTRMKWSDIRPGGREEIYLSRAITKTHAARMIPISPALAEWLDYFKAAGYPVGTDEPLVPRPVGPGQTDYDLLCIHIAEARERAQLEIPRNALRHTAASALCVLLGRSKAADILGHSESMLVKHYRWALTEEEAAELVGITPAQLGLPNVQCTMDKVQSES